MEELNSKKRVRDDSVESNLDLPEVKRLRDDLLNIFDDSDSLPVNQDLASVMKSFEDEISAAAAASTSVVSVPVVDLTTDSGDSQSDLGYLLEASDDELGLPPTETKTDSEEERSKVTELVRVDSDSSRIGELWGFEDHIPSYDSFDFEIGDNYNGDHVSFDGLFEYPDVYYDSSEFSGLLWLPETLSAE